MKQGSGLRIYQGSRLEDCTSIRLGGSPIASIDIESMHGYAFLADALQALGGDVAILGAGTNIIASDTALPVVLLRQHEMGEIQLIGTHEERILVQVDGATRLSRLLRFLVQHDLSGLEGLCGIPGSVGGAVAMNAGSYGTDMATCLKSVTIFSPQLGLVELPASQFCFGYRTCQLPQHDAWFMVVRAVFACSKGHGQQIRGLLQEYIRRKKQTQPVAAHSAGCVFKNPPEGLSAGKLLDDAGFRGKHLGGMCFSSLHANFLVNEGKGSFSAAMDLIGQAQAKVAEVFGIPLELEVKIWA